MDLKDFISETLIQIQEGVQNAIDHRISTPGSAGVINPRARHLTVEKLLRPVEFDVAVTVSSNSSGGGKAGIKVFSAIEVGAQGAQSSEHSTVSRIKFQIPIIAPVTDVTDDGARK